MVTGAFSRLIACKYASCSGRLFFTPTLRLSLLYSLDSANRRHWWRLFCSSKTWLAFPCMSRQRRPRTGHIVGTDAYVDAHVREPCLLTLGVALRPLHRARDGLAASAQPIVITQRFGITQTAQRGGCRKALAHAHGLGHQPRFVHPFNPLSDACAQQRAVHRQLDHCEFLATRLCEPRLRAQGLFARRERPFETTYDPIRIGSRHRCACRPVNPSKPFPQKIDRVNGKLCAQPVAECLVGRRPIEPHITGERLDVKAGSTHDDRRQASRADAGDGRTSVRHESRCAVALVWFEKAIQ